MLLPMALLLLLLSMLLLLLLLLGLLPLCIPQPDPLSSGRRLVLVLVLLLLLSAWLIHRKVAPYTWNIKALCSRSQEHKLRFSGSLNGLYHITAVATQSNPTGS